MNFLKNLYSDWDHSTLVASYDMAVLRTEQNLLWKCSTEGKIKWFNVTAIATEREKQLKKALTANKRAPDPTTSTKIHFPLGEKNNDQDS